MPAKPPAPVMERASDLQWTTYKGQVVLQIHYEHLFTSRDFRGVRLVEDRYGFKLFFDLGTGEEVLHTARKKIRYFQAIPTAYDFLKALGVSCGEIALLAKATRGWVYQDNGFAFAAKQSTPTIGRSRLVPSKLVAHIEERRDERTYYLVTLEKGPAQYPVSTARERPPFSHDTPQPKQFRQFAYAVAFCQKIGITRIMFKMAGSKIAKGRTAHRTKKK